MSFPGLPAPDDPQQPQQPLFGQPVVDPNVLKIREMLAQQLMQQGQNEQPISSWTQVANKALSPLMGVLMQKRAAQQQAELQAGMAQELPGILSASDPIKAMALSKNPLIRQMMAAAVPEYLKSGFDTQAEIHKRTLLDPMDIAKKQTEDVNENTAKLNYNKANISNEAALAGAKAAAELKYKLQETAAGQAASFAANAEKKREFDATQGGGSGTVPGSFGQNPASLYGGKTP